MLHRFIWSFICYAAVQQNSGTDRLIWGRAGSRRSIVVPTEWSKPAGDYSGFGLDGRGDVPYLSTQESGPQSPEVSALNTAVVGSWLSTFIRRPPGGTEGSFSTRE